MLTTAALLILIVTVGSGVSYYYFRNGATASNHPNQSASETGVPFSTKTVTVTAGSSVQSSSNSGSSTYSIRVTGITIAQSPEVNGYIIDVDATYSGSGTWQVNPQDFEVVSNASAVYELSPGNDILGMTTPLSSVILVGGQQAAGQLAFQIPPGQSPSELEYLNQTDKISVSTHEMPQTLTYDCQGPSVQVGVSSSSPLGANANGGSTGYTISGEQMAVDVTVGVVITQSGAAVTAVTTTSSGISITGVNPPLPAALSSSGGVGQAASLTVTVSTPSDECVQTIDLQVTIGTP